MKPSQKAPTLDLHGFKTDEVYDAIEEFFRKNSSKKTVHIMPGKGSGKVKAEVIQYLKLAKYPWSYLRMSNGQNNEGVLIVHME